jgi:uncharacterized protein
MQEFLIVDGYNIIGTACDMRRLQGNLEQARDELIDRLAEYQAYKGIRVYVVFDAHKVPGIGRKIRHKNIQIIFTRKNETADECIEKLVKQLERVQRRIYVATSDYTEQRVIFAGGALRKSARELMNELDQMEKAISRKVQEKYQRQKRASLPLEKNIAEILEKLRRGK